MSSESRLQTINSPDDDPTCVTYIMNGEDDTLGNSLRYIISNYKEVECAHYTRPHPTEDKIHFRIQTYGDTPGKLRIYFRKNVDFWPKFQFLSKLGLAPFFRRVQTCTENLTA